MARTPVGDERGVLRRLDGWRVRQTSPSPLVEDPEDRRRAAMSANVALALLLILALSAVISAFTSTLFPDPDVSLGYDGTALLAAEAVVSWIALRSARRPRYEVGAWLLVISLDVFVFVFGMMFPEHGASLALGYAVPVACATIFLGARSTLVVFVLSGILGSAHLILTDVSPIDASFIIGTMVAVTALTLVVAMMRERDVEEAVRLRELAEEASHFKTDFLSRMSHELRTPLNSILGFGQLLELESDELTESQRESVAYVLRAGRHLLDLINEVLDITRIESGQLTLSLEPMPMREAIDHCVALVQPLADQRQLTVIVDRSSCEQLVLADRQRLRQIVLNLLANAVKYNRLGGLVTVGCSVDDGVERARIMVTDTGPGLSPAQQERLFIPFERLGADPEVEGSGVGLAVSQRLATAMGGALGVESAPGIGSSFWVELALAGPTSEIADSGTSERGLDPEPVPLALTVLYIEDDVANLALVERVLSRRRGVSLLTAMQGSTGLDLAIRRRPDLILLDLHLPDMRGDNVLHRLWADERTRSIPVAILSADASPAQIRRLREAGAHAYLTKPLDVQLLLDLIDRVAAGPRGEAEGSAR